jgi:hypothetical protein
LSKMMQSQDDNMFEVKRRFAALLVIIISNHNVDRGLRLCPCAKCNAYLGRLTNAVRLLLL